jgi:predicted aspartyl protease
MPAYDDGRFAPAAPVVNAVLRNPQNGAVLTDVPMLIDSGADITLLPKAVVDSLGIESSGTRYELMSFDGTKSTSAAVRADLLLLRKTFRGQYLLVDQEVGILGRDILNNISLWLNGPYLIWEEGP